MQQLIVTRSGIQQTMYLTIILNTVDSPAFISQDYDYRHTIPHLAQKWELLGLEEGCQLSASAHIYLLLSTLKHECVHTYTENVNS